MRKKAIKRRPDFLTAKVITECAINAEMPRGWYQGPSFDANGKIVNGVPNCLRNFAALIVMHYVVAEKKNAS